MKTSIGSCKGVREVLAVACFAVPALLGSYAAAQQTSQLKDLEFDSTSGRTIYVDSPTATGAGNRLEIVAGPANGSYAGGNVVVTAGSSTFAWGSVLLNPTTGFVGIGTSNPGQPLDVNGNVKFTGALMPNNVAGTTGQFILTQGRNTAPVWTVTFSSPIAVAGGGSLAFYGSSVTLSGANALIGQNDMPATSTGITTSGGVHAAFLTGEMSGVTFSSTGTIPGDAIIGNPMIFISSVATTSPQNCVSLSWTKPYVGYTIRFFSPSESTGDIPCLMWGYGGTLPATFDDGAANTDYAWWASHLYSHMASNKQDNCQQLTDTQNTAFNYEQFFLIHAFYNVSGVAKPMTSTGMMDEAPSTVNNDNPTLSAGSWVGPAGDKTKLITGAKICLATAANKFAAGAIMMVYGSY
ncbi:MAG: hypothetical protein NTX64_14265 [Elusimicrobia bacterium]|nr:hypothetical protein [Elusimicrobiota bacterium]